MNIQTRFEPLAKAAGFDITKSETGIYRNAKTVACFIGFKMGVQSENGKVHSDIARELKTAPACDVDMHSAALIVERMVSHVEHG